MSRLARFQQVAEAVGNVGIDMSQTSKGGAGRRLLPVGRAYARLIGYREFGNHAREYQGQAKAAAPVIRLTFALWGKGDPQGPDTPENLYHYKADDGTVKPGRITSFDLVLGNNEKSKTKKAFDKMNWTGKHKGFRTMLNEAFLLVIKQKTGKGPNAKPYNEVDWDSILPPNDPMTGNPYGIPEVPDEDFHMFLWDNPTKEDWDEMFIDGQNDKGESKNFMQAKCISATNFKGSLLEQLLGGELPDVGMVESDDDPEDAPAAPEANLPAAPVAVPDTPAPTAVPDVPVVAAAVAQVTDSPLPNPGEVPGLNVAVPAVPAVPTIPGL